MSLQLLCTNLLCSRDITELIKLIRIYIWISREIVTINFFRGLKIILLSILCSLSVGFLNGLLKNVRHRTRVNGNGFVFGGLQYKGLFWNCSRSDPAGTALPRPMSKVCTTMSLREGVVSRLTSAALSGVRRTEWAPPRKSVIIRLPPGGRDALLSSLLCSTPTSL